jgi:hypothetical protein
VIRRMLWLGVGIAVGAVVARQVSRTVQAYSPANLAGTARNSAAGLWDSVRDFMTDVREGMVEKEAEIQAAFERGESLDDDLLGHDFYDGGDDFYGRANGARQRIHDDR